MLKTLIMFLCDTSGATKLEAALIAAILGVALMDVLISRGPRTSGELSQVSVLRR